MNHRSPATNSTVVSVISSFSGVAAFDPFVDFFFLEFPEAADFVGKHILFAYPLIGGIALDAKIFRYSIDREPSVFHALTPLLWWFWRDLGFALRGTLVFSPF